MSSNVSGALLDAAAVCRLTQSISEFCAQQLLHHQYVGASPVFFEHTRAVADGVLQFLHKLELSENRSARRIKAERLKLGTIKAYWSSIHELLKPAADAHTLSVPIPLVEALTDLCADIPSIKHAQITVLLSEQLNYFQSQHTGLKEVYSKLRTVLPGLPSFPVGLGFIGVPFSQASSLFTNLVIFHELGHFIFEETEKIRDLETIVSDTVNTIRTATLTTADLLWVQQTVLRWAEEIFCDLFAIRLVGPAYTFAYLELLNVIGGTNTKIASGFHSTHPADACRLREHLAKLRSDGWSNILDLDIEHCDLLKTLAGINDSEYRLVLADASLSGSALIQAFIRILPEVRKLSEECFSHNNQAPARLRDRIEHVYSCLEQGIIPSAAFDEQQPSFLPDMVALTNAAFAFYLEAMSRLIKNIDGETETDVFAIAKWSRQVEMWTLKSIENLRLRQSGIANGRSV